EIKPLYLRHDHPGASDILESNLVQKNPFPFDIHQPGHQSSIKERVKAFISGRGTSYDAAVKYMASFFAFWALKFYQLVAEQAAEHDVAAVRLLQRIRTWYHILHDWRTSENSEENDFVERMASSSNDPFLL
ncbi:unnamed protein product, partial [Amoebophrya sp. A25]